MKNGSKKMTTIKCPSCGNAAAESADACPHCGMPFKAEKLKTNHILHLILSICTLGLWIFIWAIVALSNGLENANRRGKMRKKMRRWARA